MIDKDQAEEFLNKVHKKDFEKLLLALNLQNVIINDFGFDVEIHYSPSSSTALIDGSKLPQKNAALLVSTVKRAMPVKHTDIKYFASKQYRGVRMAFEDDFYIFVKVPRRDDESKSKE